VAGLLEVQTAFCKDRFPYIPTLLSFREVSPAVSCIKKLHLQPDIFLVDGHGIAHPYRCGFASHLGLVIRKPTIGVAKSKLVGEIREKGENALLTYKGEIVGSVVTTKQGFKPVYVSVGHMTTLDRAIEVVKHCARGSRVPEPILRAHEIATEEARKIKYFKCEE
jgi:deoxyribonuclease V